METHLSTFTSFDNKSLGQSSPISGCSISLMQLQYRIEVASANHTNQTEQKTAKHKHKKTIVHFLGMMQKL